jgi:putative PEP-CTERM system histidine kinase
MIHLPSILAYAAAALTTALVLLTLLKSPRGPQKILLVLAGLALSAEQVSLALVHSSRTLDAFFAAFRPLIVSTALFPVVGFAFCLVLGKRDDRDIARRHLPWIIGAGIAAAAVALTFPIRFYFREIHFVELGRFWGLTVSGWGKAAGAYLLVANVCYLYCIENTYRAANVAGRVTLKYPLLGILTTSVINFIVLGRLLAIALIDRHYLAVHSAGIIILSASFIYATYRYRLLSMQIYIGRRFATSAVAVVVSGAYFLALALITYTAGALGLPFDRLTIIILGLFAAFLLIAILISGKAKRKMRQLIDENFYINRYDYRQEWRRYAALLAESATVDDLATNIVSSLCETMLVKQGILHISTNGSKTAFHGFREEGVNEAVIAGIGDLLARESVVISKQPIGFEGSTAREQATEPDENAWIMAAARLGWAGEEIGFIALGEKHMKTSYTEEDRNFLETVAVQTTAALENLFLEERIHESKQIEAFARFASFMIHDLKNTVGMLSLTAENAKANIGNEEFQKDAIDTVERSVEKMRRLIDSLKTFETSHKITKSETDVRALMDTTLAPMKQIATASGVALEWRVEGSISALLDKDAMRRVIENIVLNGIEAASKGGNVTADARTAAENRLHIIVTDDGTGFDPEYLKNNLFSPFSSTKKGGLGIGLMLCKSIVESHGGRLHIESRPGGGSTVAIQLPMD